MRFNARVVPAAALACLLFAATTAAAEDKKVTAKPETAAKAEAEPAKEAKDTMDSKDSIDRLKSSAAQTLDAAKDMARSKADPYVEKAQKELDKLDKKIARYKAESTVAIAAVQAKIEELEKKRVEVKKRIDEFTTATREAGEDVKKGIDNAIRELSDTYEKAKSRFDK